MNYIEVTEEQESKLAEMCKKLFPEYTINEVDGSGKFLVVLQFVKHSGYFIHLVDDSQSKVTSIPWLEFLLTTFQTRLYKVYDTWVNGTGADYFIELIDFGGIGAHLIDKMYTQFKQIDDKTFEYFK